MHTFARDTLRLTARYTKSCVESWPQLRAAPTQTIDTYSHNPHHKDQGTHRTYCIYIYAPEGCQHGTHTNGTAYTRGTRHLYSRVKALYTHKRTHKHKQTHSAARQSTVRAHAVAPPYFYSIRFYYGNRRMVALALAPSTRASPHISPPLQSRVEDGT